MKTLLLLALAALPLAAQFNVVPQYVFADPSGPCVNQNQPKQWSLATFSEWYCNGTPGTWTAVSSSSLWKMENGALTPSVPGRTLVVGTTVLPNYLTVDPASIFIGNASGAAGNASITGTQMVGIGFNALAGITSGSNNIGIGWNAGVHLTTGRWNVMMGHDAGAGLLGDSHDNTCIGEGTCFAAGTTATMHYNTAVGSAALLNVSNAGNTAVGMNALLNAGNTQYNTAIGNGACATVTTGSHNQCFGYGSDVGGAAATQRTAIGFNTKSWIDYTIQLGTASDAVIIAPNTVGLLLNCNSGTEGAMKPVTDSNTAVWGATVAAGGTNHVFAYCDGTVWTVMAK